jgi:hypothetical protein
MVVIEGTDKVQDGAKVNLQTAGSSNPAAPGSGRGKRGGQ